MPKNVEMGPSGGTGGGLFSTEALPHQRITRINCRSGNVIDKLLVTSEDIAGGGNQRDWELGGNGGALGQELLIPEDDFILRVVGYYGSVVDNLTIVTASGRIQRYGGNGGRRSFHYEAPDQHEIAGFIGSRGANLDSLGVIIRRRP